MTRSNERRRPRFTLYFQTTQITLRSILEVPDLLLGLGGQQPKNLSTNLTRKSPIIDARVCALTDRYSGNYNNLVGDRYQPNEKPLYLKAEINPKNRIRGEGTGKSAALRDLIRRRGNFENDDCGHILAQSLGGKMVHFNLFPQNYLINEGWIPYSRVWKWGLEWMMRAWLTFQCRHNPGVRLQVKLLYNDTEYPDRPSSLMFWVEFFKDDNEDSDTDTDTDEDEHVLEETVAFEGEVVNSPLEFTVEQAVELTNEIKLIIEAFRDCRAECNIEELKEFLKRLIETLEELLPEPEQSESDTQPPQPVPSTSSSWFFWDFVPIIGPIRILSDSIDCAKENNTKGFLVNYTLGVTTLALDIFTLGSAGLAISSACKLAAKEGTKQVTRSVLKGAAKGAIKQAAISATVNATVGGVMGGTEGAVKGLVSGAIGGAFGGGLNGSARGAVKASAKAAADSAMLAAERAAKEAATQAARDAAISAGKQAAREAAKTAVKEATRGIAANELKGLLAQELRNRVACGSVIKDTVSEAARVMAGR